MSKIDFAFLDSGAGGLPYMTFLKRRFPQYSCVYLADAQNFPYGKKTPQQIKDCAISVTKKIIEHWTPACLIVACNTISVTALDVLREVYAPLQIIGTVPAIKLAAEVTKNGNIGLLATKATINDCYTDNLIKEFATLYKVHKLATSDLVAFVEHKLATATKKQRYAAIAPMVEYFKTLNCDTIILGCTHFTHLVEDFKEVAGQNVQIVDSRCGVACHAVEVLNKNPPQFLQKDCDIEDCSLFVTKCSKQAQKEYKAISKKLNLHFSGVLQEC